jgi:endonuclease V-like protein UPF0215 family
VNVIGFDDGPFTRTHRGGVLLVGAVCASTRLDGVVTGRVQRDGVDATRRMIDLVQGGPFRAHVRAVLLQGIAVGGFNVVDVRALSEALAVPVLVVMRRPPDFEGMRRALFSIDPPIHPPLRGAARKWRLIEQAGTPELVRVAPPAATRSSLSTRARVTKPTGLRDKPQQIWVQRVGLSLEEAHRLILSTTLHGNLPEALRLAHLIAGGVARGKSRGRA